MRIIAHRGGISRGCQNSPRGVRLAVEQGADFVELDVRKPADAGFQCAHGRQTASLLEDCLAEIGGLGLVAHLKGPFSAADLLALTEEISRTMPLERVIFASHRSGPLRALADLEGLPALHLARFGFLAGLVALGRKPPWTYCLLPQVTLCGWQVRALQRRGQRVFASCVWEWRDRQAVAKLGVDGAFWNLRE